MRHEYLEYVKTSVKSCVFHNSGSNMRSANETRTMKIERMRGLLYQYYILYMTIFVHYTKPYQINVFAMELSGSRGVHSNGAEKKSIDSNGAAFFVALIFLLNAFY